MNPYFSVGEEVILCSVDRPEHNGEYVVEYVFNKGERHHCRITGKVMIFNGYSSPCAYSLAGLLTPHPSNGLETVWNQSALRKKHKGSDKSFDQIVKSMHLTGATS